MTRGHTSPRQWLARATGGGLAMLLVGCRRDDTAATTHATAPGAASPTATPTSNQERSNIDLVDVLQRVATQAGVDADLAAGATSERALEGAQPVAVCEAMIARALAGGAPLDPSAVR